MTHTSETHHQSAEAAGGQPPAATPSTSAAPRPGTLMLAGAGSILAVLAFLGGLAVGHSWDGTSNQQGQFGGPGGGIRGGFPGQGNGPAQNGTPQNGTPQNGTPQNGTPQNGSGFGQANR